MASLSALAQEGESGGRTPSKPQVATLPSPHPAAVSVYPGTKRDPCPCRLGDASHCLSVLGLPLRNFRHWEGRGGIENSVCWNPQSPAGGKPRFRDCAGLPDPLPGSQFQLLLAKSLRPLREVDFLLASLWSHGSPFWCWKPGEAATKAEN